MSEQAEKTFGKISLGLSIFFALAFAVIGGIWLHDNGEWLGKKLRQHPVHWFVDVKDQPEFRYHHQTWKTQFKSAPLIIDPQTMRRWQQPWRPDHSFQPSRGNRFQGR
jgi:hypothetical protein